MPPSTQAKPFSEIPGPSQIPFFGNLLSFARESRLDWIAGLRERYGDYVRLKLFEENVVLIHYPDWVKYVLQSNYKDFAKMGKAIEKGREVLGNGLFTSEGEFWRKQRRLAQPAFYKRKLELLALTMVECIEDMLKDWEAYAESGEVVDIAQEMMRLTLNVVTRSLFSSTMSQEEFDLFSRLFPQMLKETNRRIINPFPFLNKIPVQTSMDYEKNLEKIDAILFRMIREREESGKEYDDLLGMLMAARDEDSGQGMSEKQLRDEVMTIFIAGHETTAQALTWGLLELYRQGDIRTKVEQEAQTVLGDRSPTMMDFMALPLLQ